MTVAPDQRDRAILLVAALGRGLEEYHGESAGNLACWMQAARILTADGNVLSKHPLQEFYRVEGYDAHGPPVAVA
jgi:hypothetical protein